MEIFDLTLYTIEVRTILDRWLVGNIGSVQAVEKMVEQGIPSEDAPVLLAMCAWGQPGPVGCLGTA